MSRVNEWTAHEPNAWTERFSKPTNRVSNANIKENKTMHGCYDAYHGTIKTSHAQTALRDCHLQRQKCTVLSLAPAPAGSCSWQKGVVPGFNQTSDNSPAWLGKWKPIHNGEVWWCWAAELIQRSCDCPPVARGSACVFSLQTITRRPLSCCLCSLLFWCSDGVLPSCHWPGAGCPAAPCRSR